VTLVIVGVGAMGSALAARLVERGLDVLGVDPAVAASGPATTADGIAVVRDLAAAAKALPEPPSDLLVFVRMADQVHEVLAEAARHRRFDGVPAAVLSTLAPGDARAVLERFGGERPVAEAPVSGGVSGARAGTLTVMAAGPLGRWVEAAAARVHTFAEPGQPAAAKLLNNALGAANAHALAAALAQADGFGIAPAEMLEVIRGSSGGGWMAEHFEDFPVDLLWKDFTLLHPEYPVRFPPFSIDTDLLGAIASARARLAH